MSVTATAQEAGDIKHTKEMANERERTNHIQFKQLNTVITMMVIMIIIIHNYYSRIFKNEKKTF
jgi:hypothetical protein